MTELIFKKKLQEYLTSNTSNSWYGDANPRCFVNVYSGQGKVTELERSTNSNTVNLELSVELHGTDLDVLDDSLLTQKDQINELTHRIMRSGIPVNLNEYKALSIGKNLKFLSWNKSITVQSVSETELNYLGKLSMIFQITFPGYL